MEEEKKTYTGSLTIEHVSNGYIMTTGKGGRCVASSDKEALSAIAGMFKSSLPKENMTVTIQITTIE